MLDPETKRTLITCCTTVFGTISAVIITQFFTYLNSKSNKNDSIYKQQYDQIFSPIHRILFFSPSQRVTDDLEIISNIIYDNYSLASDTLIEEFGKCFDNNKITKEFEHIIQSGYILLRNKLGYSKLKLNKTVKQDTSKTIIITSSKKNLMRNIIDCFVYSLIPLILVIATLIITALADKLS